MVKLLQPNILYEINHKGKIYRFGYDEAQNDYFIQYNESDINRLKLLTPNERRQDAILVQEALAGLKNQLLVQQN